MNENKQYLLFFQKLNEITMSAFLEKIGLQKSFTCELEIRQVDLVSRLRKHVDDRNLSFFFDILDVFSFNKNEYKGHVTDRGFKIRRKRKLFSRNSNQAVATGTFVQKDQKVQINVVISGANYALYVFSLIAIVFPFLIYNGHFEGFKNPFLFFIILFMLIIHYFIIRKGVKTLKQDLEQGLIS